jgi:branched-chain amino acid transport system substrate-binding protein
MLVAGVFAAGCSGGDKAATPVETTSCSDVIYEGEGTPEALIVSDLPLTGRDRETTTLMVDAIKLVLRQRGFKAGERGVGYQSCSYSAGLEPDEGLCERNARGFAAAEDVLGVVGSFHSGCAWIQIPILSRKAVGPLAMVSPANTYVGLTRPGPGARPDSGDPGSLYPDGVRNYVRVVPPDGAQGAALAHHAKTSGLHRVVTLYDRQADYTVAVSGEFLRTARALGLETLGLEWPERKSSAVLARRVARFRPDLVYLAGPGEIEHRNVKQLIAELRAVLGPRIVIAGSDNFLGPDAIEDLGSTGEGLLVAAVGTPAEHLPPGGRAFLRAFRKEGSASAGFFGAAEAAQATEVLLDAIARSDGSRASVVDELFATEVDGGILGSFHFDRNGDITPATVTIRRIQRGKAVPVRVLRIPPEAGN